MPPAYNPPARLAEGIATLDLVSTNAPYRVIGQATGISTTRVREHLVAMGWPRRPHGGEASGPATTGPGEKNAARRGAHLVFVDESGFLLIPTVRRTWAPRGQTPYLRHRYRHDRLSVCSGLAVSPQRRRVALYLRCRPRALTGLDMRAFLRHLLRHLRGPVDLLWDRGPIHRRREVQAFLRRHPRLQIHYFPAYAPELNPAEYVWAQADQALANGAPDDLSELRHRLGTTVRRLRRSRDLLWSCIYASDLPWVR
jgi:transposase